MKKRGIYGKGEKDMLRKMICILCAGMLALTLEGCAGNKDVSDTDSHTVSSEQDKSGSRDTKKAEKMAATEAKCSKPGPEGFVVTKKYAAFYTPEGFGSSGEGVVEIHDANDIYNTLFEKEGKGSGLMGTADKIYFVSNNDMYSYSGGTEAETILTGINGFAGFIGMIDGVIYYETVTDDPSVPEMKIIAYDTETNEQKEFDLESAFGNVVALITGDHLFYLGGATDPSATPLYELNLKSGKSIQLEQYVSSMASDEKGKLYYTSFGSADTIQGKMTLKSYNMLTKKTEEVYQPSINLGTIVSVDSSGAYFELGIDRHALFRVDFETKEQKTLSVDENVYYLPDCMGNTFYCVKYATDSDMNITKSWVYEYDPDAENESGTSLKLRADIDLGQVLGIGYGIVFGHERDDYGETYGVAPATLYDDQMFY